MEILQFLISFLSKSQNLQKFAPLIKLFSENSFDINKVLKSLSPDVVKPIIEQFASLMNNKSPTDSVGQSVGLEPISNIADKDIVYALNKHLGQA